MGCMPTYRPEKRVWAVTNHIRLKPHNQLSTKKWLKSSTTMPENHVIASDIQRLTVTTVTAGKFRRETNRTLENFSIADPQLTHTSSRFKALRNTDGDSFKNSITSGLLNNLEEE